MSAIITPFPSRRAAATPTAATPRREQAAGSAMHYGAKMARLRVEHPDAAALIEQLIDDSLGDGPPDFDR